MRVQNAKLKSTTWQLMAVTFVGIHVPLVALIIHGLVSSFAGLLWIFMTVLVATLLSTIVSLGVVYRVMTSIESSGITSPGADARSSQAA